MSGECVALGSRCIVRSWCPCRSWGSKRAARARDGGGSLCLKDTRVSAGCWLQQETGLRRVQGVVRQPRQQPAPSCGGQPWRPSTPRCPLGGPYCPAREETSSVLGAGTCPPCGTGCIRTQTLQTKIGWQPLEPCLGLLRLGNHTHPSVANHDRGEANSKL